MNMLGSKINTPAILKRAKELVESGAWDEAITLLTESNELEENGRIERRLVKLRHLMFDEIAKPEPIHCWPKSVPDLFPGLTGLPEIPAANLSADLVTSGIQHHGSIIVRGLFDADTCSFVRQTIDDAFAAADSVAGKKDFEPTPWYEHFVQQRNKGYKFGGIERHFVAIGSGMLAVDSPRAMTRYLNCISDAGIDKFIYEYFGERPAISAKKSTLRRTPPDSSVGWHQDGGYFRTKVRALNIWTAFSSCGVSAPSLDVFAKRFDHLVERGGDGIAGDAISEENAAACGLENVVRPEFEPGDALLFDEMALHRTGVAPTMTQARYAVEMWFFASSMFPRDQVPLYL